MQGVEFMETQSYLWEYAQVLSFPQKSSPDTVALSCWVTTALKPHIIMEKSVAQSVLLFHSFKTLNSAKAGTV